MAEYINTQPEWRRNGHPQERKAKEGEWAEKESVLAIEEEKTGWEITAEVPGFLHIWFGRRRTGNSVVGRKTKRNLHPQKETDFT
jgi:hypothetical protein